MIRKHGSEEAVRQFMSESAKQVTERGEAGFASMKKRDPERVREISKLGVAARAKKRKEADETNAMAQLDRPV